MSAESAAIVRSTFVALWLKSASLNKIPLRNTCSLPESIANVLLLLSAPVKVTWPESAVYIKLVNSNGAEPVPLAWTYAESTS